MTEFGLVGRTGSDRSRLESGNGAVRGAPRHGTRRESGNHVVCGAPGDRTRLTVGKRVTSTPARSRKPTGVGKRREQPVPPPTRPPHVRAAAAYLDRSNQKPPLDPASFTEWREFVASTPVKQPQLATRCQGWPYATIEWRLSTASTAPPPTWTRRRHQRRTGTSRSSRVTHPLIVHTTIRTRSDQRGNTQTPHPRRTPPYHCC